MTRRLWLIALVALVVVTVSFTWFLDCTHRLCRLFDLYTYEVTSLDEFREHLAGTDLYARHQAHKLRLDTEGLRLQVAAAMDKQLKEVYAQKKLAPGKGTRLMSAGLARVEGGALHLTDDVRYGKETVGKWALAVKSFMQDEPKDATQRIYQSELRTLFDKAVLHAGGATETVALAQAPESD